MYLLQTIVALRGGTTIALNELRTIWNKAKRNPAMSILSASRLELPEGATRPGETGDKNTVVRRRPRPEEGPQATRTPHARPAHRAGLSAARA